MTLVKQDHITHRGNSYLVQEYRVNDVLVVVHHADVGKLHWGGISLPLRDGRVAYVDGFAQLVTVAGHNWNKIDPAVPQPWLDERHFRGDRENYCWTYETAPVFGQALAYSTLIREATANIEADILQQETQDATL